jgi:hypothetical protein
MTSCTASSAWPSCSLSALRSAALRGAGAVWLGTPCRVYSRFLSNSMAPWPAQSKYLSALRKGRGGGGGGERRWEGRACESVCRVGG